MNQTEVTPLGLLLRSIPTHLHPELLRALAAISTDNETQARYDYLADRHTEGLNTPEEREELGAIVMVNTYMSLIKNEARATLARQRK